MLNQKVHNIWPALRIMSFSFFFNVWFFEVAEHALFLEVSYKTRKFIIFGRP